MDYTRFDCFLSNRIYQQKKIILEIIASAEKPISTGRIAHILGEYEYAICEERRDMGLFDFVKDKIRWVLWCLDKDGAVVRSKKFNGSYCYRIAGAPEPPAPSQSKPPKEKHSRSVQTYFVQSEQGGPVKIGKSVNPESRLKSLQTGHPQKLKIIKLIDADIEVELHERFAYLRGAGEWFHYTPDIEAFLSQH